MSESTRAEERLNVEVAELRARLEEAEQALRAIHAGEVDALVVQGPAGPQIYTLQGADAESNRLRGELLAHVSDAVIVVDSRQRLTYLNASAERQYGVVASEVIGLPIDRVYQRCWLEAGDEARALAALHETGHWRGELIHLTCSGARMHVETSVSRLDDTDGRGPGLLKVVRDITHEHKLRVAAQHQQERIKQSEARLKRVLDQLFLSVWILDLDGTVIECNAAALERAALNVGDVIGKRLWQMHCFLDAAVSEQVRQATARALQGETVRFDACCRFSAGESSTLDIQLAPLRDGSGTVTNIIVSGVDIEERVTALRELQESEATALDSARRLDQAHRMLEATLEAAPVGIAVADPQCQILKINQAGAELLGIADSPQRTLLHGPLHGWLHASDPESRVPLSSNQWPLEQAVAQRRAVTTVIEITPGGTAQSRTVLTSAAPVLDVSGEVIAGVMVQVDITKRVQAEAALRLADRQKDEFLATLAHELRNPLAPIRTAVELIRRVQPVDARIQRAQIIMERQVLHLSRLVDDLLDVSRITRGSIELRQETLDLGSLVLGAVDSVRPTLEAAALTLELQVDQTSVLIRGDAVRVAQCVVNLLNNAVKFTPRGGMVRLRVAREGAMAVVEVNDTGVGITPSNLERVFDLFVQEQRSGIGGNSGLGIGLALTRKLVELHGGNVRAQSGGHECGSTFRIELPAAGTDALQPHPLAEKSVDDGTGAGAGAGASVLVVDDNRDAADTLGEMLAMSGFLVMTEYSGAAAVRAVEQARPGAVLLDIGLPDMDGYEVCRRIRQSAVPRQPIVIALTGWAQEKDRDRATAAGFNGHLTKPAEPDRVIKLLQELLVKPAQRTGVLPWEERL